MDNYGWLILGAGLLCAGLTWYVVQYGRQRQRVNDAEAGVNAFLRERYTTLPAGIRIHCSHDLSWPVLVFFVHPVTGLVHRLQFSFAQTSASLLLISDDPIVR